MTIVIQVLLGVALFNAGYFFGEKDIKTKSRRRCRELEFPPTKKVR